jgi:hypothetical protein
MHIMKRGKRLLFLIVIMIVVLAGYATVSHMTAGTGEDGGTVTGDPITLISIKKDSVKRLEWIYEGQTIALEKSQGTWKYTGDEKLPLNLSVVESMLGAVSEVRASRSIKDIADLSEYGLDDPGYVIEVQYSDDGKYRMSIGDKNPVTNEYYMRTDDDAAVYMIDGNIPSSFSYALMELVMTESIPYMSGIDSFTVTTPEGTDRIVYLTSSEGITYTNVYKWFYEVEGEGGKGHSPLSTDKVVRLLDRIRNLKWNSCAEYDAGAGDLDAYGLSEPRITVTVEYSGTEKAFAKFELLIGDDANDDECYAMLKDSKMVYLIDSSVADSLLKCDYASLRPDDVCLMDWNTVESMDVEVDGKRITIDFNRGGEGLSFLVNGSEADFEKVAELLNAINALETVDEKEGAESAYEPEVTVVFRRNTEYFGNMTLKLARYDSSHYLVSFIGQSRLLVPNADVSSLKSAFHEIAGQ